MSAQQFHAAHEALLEQWAAWLKQDLYLAKDGVVDPEFYFDPSNRPRIVCIMKEVNATPFAPQDLRPYLMKGGRGQTWNNVVRWVDVVRSAWLNGGNKVAVGNSLLPHITASHRKDVLRSISVMNLKKLPGSDSSDMATVYGHARHYSKLLSDQLHLMQPDIIIAAGVQLSVIGGFENEKGGPLSWKQFQWRGHRGSIIWTWHPQARGAKPLESYRHVEQVMAECLNSLEQSEGGLIELHVP